MRAAFAGLWLLALLGRSEAFALQSRSWDGAAWSTRLEAQVPPPWAPSSVPSKHPPYSLEWARERGLEPGYGGIWPGNPNANKYSVTIMSKNEPEKKYTLDVPSDRYIYYYFEEKGIDLPIINKLRMCRQGCCTICTVKVESGTVKMDAPLGLLKEFREKNYALTCCSFPRSDLICELQDEDETYIKQWSEGFEGGGIEWGGLLLDED